MDRKKFDLVIVGGGIVGLSTAFKIQQSYPNKTIAVLEKEPNLSMHQTGRNSGVIHSGLYYKPGSYKAKNCVEGRREIVAFAKEHNIKHDVCGKIVVAKDESEFPYLDKIFNIGLQNGVEGIEKINESQIKDIEPFCSGIKGIWVPCTGIIDFVGVTKTLGGLVQAINPNSKIFTNAELISIQKNGQDSLLKTKNFEISCSNSIFCGGLQADRLAKMDGLHLKKIKIVGFRGDYYDLTEKGKHKVKNLIYPIPNPKFPFLGVHFTRMVDGSIECGPNAVFTFKREGYNKTDFNLKDTIEALSYSGTMRLFLKHWKFGLAEMSRAFSKPLFLNQLRGLIPSLELEDLKPGRSGVRAMALDSKGNMLDDFHFEENGNSLHVINAPSPAATSGLAIGTEIKTRSEKLFNYTN